MIVVWIWIERGTGKPPNLSVFVASRSFETYDSNNKHGTCIGLPGTPAHFFRWTDTCLILCESYFLELGDHLLHSPKWCLIGRSKAGFGTQPIEIHWPQPQPSLTTIRLEIVRQANPANPMVVVGKHFTFCLLWFSGSPH